MTPDDSFKITRLSEWIGAGLLATGLGLLGWLAHIGGLSVNANEAARLLQLRVAIEARDIAPAVRAETLARWSNCSENHLKAAAGLADLPRGVREQLLQKGATADTGQEFWNGGDIVPPSAEHLPKRRLAFAAVDNTSVVAVIQHSVVPTEVWIFDLADGKWEGRAEQSNYQTPATLPQVLEFLCGPPQTEPLPTDASGVVTSAGDIVLKLSSRNTVTTYKLTRDPGMRGMPGYNQITYLQDGRVLSPKERATLSRNLSALKRKFSGGSAIHRYIVAYLQALNSSPSK